MPPQLLQEDHNFGFTLLWDWVCTETRVVLESLVRDHLHKINKSQDKNYKCQVII